MLAEERSSHGQETDFKISAAILGTSSGEGGLLCLGEPACGQAWSAFLRKAVKPHKNDVAESLATLRFFPKHTALIRYADVEGFQLKVGVLLSWARFLAFSPCLSPSLLVPRTLSLSPSHSLSSFLNVSLEMRFAWPLRLVVEQRKFALT
jgi:hypothetical protein